MNPASSPEVHGTRSGMFDEPGDSAWTCRQLPEGVCHKAVVGTSQRRKHDESDPTSDKYTLEQTLLSDSMLAGIGHMGIQHVCDEPKMCSTNVSNTPQPS